MSAPSASRAAPYAPLSRASQSQSDPIENAMATYNTSHGGGVGNGHTLGGPSHGMPMGHNIANGGVPMDVFDQDMNFDDSLL